MQRNFRLPVGSDGIALSLPANQQIAGITIDNPSGSWLNVPTVGAVPPYTMAWAAAPSPSALTLSVIFVDSPSGSPSTLIGEPVSVTLYDTPIAPSAGTPSGEAVSQAPSMAAIERITAGVIVMETGQVNLPFVPTGFVTPQRSLVPRKTRTSPNLISVGITQEYQLRTQTTLVVFTDPGNIDIQNIVISPENPMVEIDFPRGMVLDPGEGLTITCINSPGGGAALVTIEIEFVMYTVA